MYCLQHLGEWFWFGVVFVIFSGLGDGWGGGKSLSGLYLSREWIYFSFWVWFGSGDVLLYGTIQGIIMGITIALFGDGYILCTIRFT